MNDVSLEVTLFLVLAALVAGFVDAVVGGGGLVQLPALLVGLPGASVVQIAATNKLASFCGTSISAATYVRRIRPDPRTFLPLMLAAFAGSAGGALVASLLTAAPSTRAARFRRRASRPALRPRGSSGGCPGG